MRAALYSIAAGAAYLGVARLTAHWDVASGGVPLIGLTAGISFAAVQQLGLRCAPALVLAGCADALLAGRSASDVVLAAAAAAAVGVTGYGVTTALRVDPKGERLGVTLVRMLAAAAAALAGATFLFGGHSAHTWATLALSNVAGILVVAPAVRTWLQLRSRGVAKRWEWLALLVVTAGVAAVVGHGALGSTGPTAYVIFPVVVWAALRTGRMGVSGVILLAALVTAQNAAGNSGPFDTLVSLDSFLVVLALTGHLLVGLQQALVFTEGRHTRLLDEMPLVTYLRPLDPDRPPHYVNPQAEPLLGYPVADWYADPHFARKLTHPDDVEILDRLNETARAEGLSTGEYRMIAADGRVVWILDHQAPVANDAGDHVGVQGFVIDISERKQLEAQLARAERVESLGLLAGGIAHDFNNLLTAISGYSQLALEHGGKHDEQISRDIAEVQSAADRAAKLTRQLLAFGRRQVLEHAVVDLNAVVAETQTLLERLIGESIVVCTKLDPELARVRADADQLTQVILNLALNARDAMPGGGTLTIRTYNDGERVALEVADTGTGMDEHTRTRIFEPFFTTKEVGSGTGLGLSVVDGIVQQTRGEIAVVSEPGKGTVFRIWLPRTLDEPAPAGRAAPDAPAGSETVLLVEDEAIVRRLTTEMLERSGYRVVVADGPEAALAVDEPYDLLLTDVVMPTMNGLELARRLEAKRVLFTSGYSGSALADRNGLDADLLEKPFTREELARKVREALDARAAR